MTILLEKAFKEASKLPKKEQDALARWIIEELKAERQWEALFDDSQGELSKLAREARSEYAEKRAHQLDPNTL
jgi:mRNA-degrading endonuclease RelE of RelBE toxin-antitoxin system